MLCSGCARELPPIAGEGDAGAGVSDSRLVLIVNGKEFPCVPGDVLGREGSVARRELLNFGTVHRRHAQIGFSEGVWRITALASTRNLTEVDGVRLERVDRRVSMVDTSCDSRPERCLSCEWRALHRLAKVHAGLATSLATEFGGVRI